MGDARVREHPFDVLCAMASRLPTTIEMRRHPHDDGVQFQAIGWKATSNTRINAMNAATFVAADMNAVTGVGAP